MILGRGEEVKQEAPPTIGSANGHPLPVNKESEGGALHPIAFVSLRSRPLPASWER